MRVLLTVIRYMRMENLVAMPHNFGDSRRFDARG